jgi:multicomponent Na+:H+ antiporter subunit E
MQPPTSRSNIQSSADKPGMSQWMRFFLGTMAYAMLWVVLSGYGSHSSWIIGVPAVIAASWARSRLSSPGRKVLSARGILRLLPVFLWESFRGGIDVARRVIGLRLDVEPGVFDYQLRLAAPFERILFAVLVSLLPGTLSADMQGSQMRIHTLDLRADVTAELDRLERLVAACFGQSLADQTDLAR